MLSWFDRDALAEAINRYLGDTIAAFALDEAVSEIGARTKDGTVKQVVAMLWYHYDDVDDHKVVASMSKPPGYPLAQCPRCFRCGARSATSSKRGIPPVLARARFAAPSARLRCGSSSARCG